MNPITLTRFARRISPALAASVLLCVRLAGEVVGIDVTERSAVLDGKVFGAAGAYERVVGRVRFALDPKLAANANIRDLGLARTGAEGRVEFSADFYVLRPRDAAKGNGTVLVEVSNRGNKSLLSRFAFARGAANPRTAEEFGDGWPLEQGYTLAWIGWQWDVPDRPGALRLEPARLRDEDAAGLVRSEFVPDTPTTRLPLADRDHRPIPLAEPLRLAVRTYPEEEPVEIAGERWRVTSDGKAIELDGGLKPGLLYEFVYRGKSGVVTGLGLAAVRDFAACCKSGEQAAILGRLRYALAFGISQSGRFLRQFVYEGFNADERGRRVFDGVWADVAGAGRGSFNLRYGQASRDGNPWFNVFYPTDVFPFHDLETHDAVENRRDSLLAAARKAGAVPKIFYTNTSYEYWGRVAGLIHVTPDGRADLAPAPETRIYAIAGAQHGPGSIPPAKGSSRFMALPNDQRPVQRALLQALQRWVAEDVAPPPSVYPKIADGTLVPAEAREVPKLAGLTTPAFPRRARRLDFGPDFARTGVMTAEQVRSRGVFPLLVPVGDADGTDRGGIKLPQVAVPLGSYFGWNFRTNGGEAQMPSFLGSYLPFPKTAAEREARGDPRRAVFERYHDRADYLAQAAAAADRLVAERYILARDRERTINDCARLWDALVK